MSVIDCDTGSSTYGEVVGWTELPTGGNELHHFGWNACSSALCHEGHDGALERRYLIVPGLRSSRTYVLDTGRILAARRWCPRSSRRRLAEKAGYSRPHTVHCGPGGIFMSNLGAADGGDGPGGVALIDHDTFEVTGAWETDRGDQYFAYDLWWHLNDDVAITSEWATPSMIEDGLNPEDLLEALRPSPRLLEPLRGQVDPARRPRRRAPDGARGKACPRPPQDLGLRGGGDQRRGSVRVRVAVAPRGRPLGGEEGDHHPCRAGRDRPAPARAATLRRGSPARHRHRHVRRRSLAVRVVLGDRRAQAVRRERSA